MDDALLQHLKAALWGYMGKAADFCLGLLEAALGKLLDAAVALAGWTEHVLARIAALPLWITVPAALAVIALATAYAMRQKLYDRLLLYYDVWLLREGYRRRTLTVRRGAVRRRRVLMARPVALPERFDAVALYEAAPDRYAVAYDPVGEAAEDVRLYRRDRRAGLRAMGEDLIRHFRANVRMLRADGELRALFAVLDARDPDFAASRPTLPGEDVEKRGKKSARGETL
ncbi:conserved hypothetical protein [Solidesulfovibrio fructosivorans JJ]]|uniref:Transmembrane protein n=1 Tax=Solidesulfovibrio fructosivorans JJ] TaxID=596151 RepID=E1K0J1_SOLFR|nr:hypothetical protein [Solidesulfovibrio fructosivorans]EFL49843.1 conserved hypothetical protein [Solidesulfovibrio fructosivorans JJ]]